MSVKKLNRICETAYSRLKKKPFIPLAISALFVQFMLFSNNAHAQYSEDFIQNPKQEYTYVSPVYPQKILSPLYVKPNTPPLALSTEQSAEYTLRRRYEPSSTYQPLAVAVGFAGNNTLSLVGVTVSTVNLAGHATVTAENSTVTSKFSIGNGNNSVSLTNTTIRPDITLGDGNNSVLLNRSTIEDIHMGEGNSHLIVNNNSTIKGEISFEKGNSELNITSSSVLKKIELEEGRNIVRLQNAQLHALISSKGVTDFQAKDSTLTNIALGDKHNTVSLQNSTVGTTPSAGTVTIGNGNNSITVDTVTINQYLRVGTGKNTIRINDSTIKKDLYVGGSNSLITINTATLSDITLAKGNDTITLQDSNILKNLSVGAGNNSVDIATSHIGDVLSVGNGNNTVNSTSSTIQGAVHIGSGNNSISLNNSELLSSFSSNDGTSTISLEGSRIGGAFTAGIGDTILYAQNSHFASDVTLGKGNKNIALNTVEILGKLDIQEGNTTLSATNSILDTVAFGNGSSSVQLDATTTDNITFGDGSSTLSIVNNSAVQDIIFANGIYNVELRDSSAKHVNFSNATQAYLVANNSIITTGIQGGTDINSIMLINSTIDSIDLDANNNTLGITGSTLHSISSSTGNNSIYINNSTMSGDIELLGIGENSVNILSSSVGSVNSRNSHTSFIAKNSTLDSISLSGEYSNASIENSTIQELMLAGDTSSASFTSSTVTGDIIVIQSSMLNISNTSIIGELELLDDANTLSINTTDIHGNIYAKANDNRLQIINSTLYSPLVADGNNNTIFVGDSSIHSAELHADNNTVVFSNANITNSITAPTGNNNSLALYFTTVQNIDMKGENSRIDGMNSSIHGSVKLERGSNTIVFNTMQVQGDIYTLHGSMNLSAINSTLFSSIYSGDVTNNITLEGTTVAQHIVLAGDNNKVIANNSYILGTIYTNGITDDIYINNSVVNGINPSDGNNTIAIFNSLVQELNLSKGTNDITISNSIVKTTVGQDFYNTIHSKDSSYYGNIMANIVEFDSTNILYNDATNPTTHNIQALSIHKKENAVLYINPNKVNNTLIINGNYTTDNTNMHSFVIDVDFTTGESDYIVFNGLLSSKNIKILPVSLHVIYKDTVLQDTIANVVTINTPLPFALSTDPAIHAFPTIIGGYEYQFVETSAGVYSLVRTKVSDSTSTFSVYSRSNLQQGINVWNKSIQRTNNVILEDSTLAITNTVKELSRYASLWIEVDGGYDSFKRDGYLSSDEWSVGTTVGVNITYPIAQNTKAGVDVFVGYEENFLTLKETVSDTKDSTGTSSIVTLGAMFSLSQAIKENIGVFGTLTVFSNIISNEVEYKKRTVGGDEDTWNTYSINTAFNIGTRIQQGSWVFLPQISFMYSYFAGQDFIAVDNSFIDISDSHNIFAQANILVAYTTALGIEPYITVGIEQPIYSNAKSVHVANLSQTFAYNSTETTGKLGLGMQYSTTLSNSMALATGIDLNSYYSHDQYGFSGIVNVQLTF